MKYRLKRYIEIEHEDGSFERIDEEQITGGARMSNAQILYAFENNLKPREATDDSKRLNG